MKLLTIGGYLTIIICVFMVAECEKHTAKIRAGADVEQWMQMYRTK